MVNMLTKWKVCAVSGKAHTTRSKQTATYFQDNVQLVSLYVYRGFRRSVSYNIYVHRSKLPLAQHDEHRIHRRLGNMLSTNQLLILTG
ncbi:unnamed protein product [Schistosoma mattheei]|uniref:Uncharacterized protein n=1 Tax=Schistosoma mattheei TaxID=31246 RepID=A0A3P8D5M9_9TREM|nr:unnamed protein product [Schistosoma mattheei]